MRTHRKHQRRKRIRQISPGQTYLQHFNHYLQMDVLNKKREGLSDLQIMSGYQARTYAAMHYARSQFASLELAQQAEREADSIVLAATRGKIEAS